MRVVIDTASATHVKHHCYHIDDQLGRLVDNRRLQSRLYRLYLHATTSHCVVDTLTGRTGTEEALYGLAIGLSSSSNPPTLSSWTCSRGLPRGVRTIQSICRLCSKSTGARCLLSRNTTPFARKCHPSSPRPGRSRSSTKSQGPSAVWTPGARLSCGRGPLSVTLHSAWTASVRTTLPPSTIGCMVPEIKFLIVHENFGPIVLRGWWMNGLRT